MTDVAGPFAPVHLSGTKPADYLRELSRNPDILAKNIEQASDIAGVFGVVSEKSLGNLRPRVRTWDPAELKKLADSGLTPRQIADKLGISFDNVRARLSRIGIKYRPERKSTLSPPVTDIYGVISRTKGG